MAQGMTALTSMTTLKNTWPATTNGAILFMNMEDQDIKEAETEMMMKN